LALDWGAFPRGAGAQPEGNNFDAVIIGSGLGGLSCATAFARQGFRALVLEQHDRPGGYATTFKRPGGFEFDVSLHSTVMGGTGGVHNVIPGFPEITEVEFHDHPSLYRMILPDYDIRVPQSDVQGYAAELTRLFPEEKEGIAALIGDMKGVTADIEKLSASRDVDMSRFPVEFPNLVRSSMMTWGGMVDARLSDPKLKSIFSALWGYYGLPPSKLASFYYAMPTYSYLTEGGRYPKGKSQALSNAFVKFIESQGGSVKLKARVEEILVKDGAAYGVKTADGTEYTGKVVISNANAFDTFKKMMSEEDLLAEYVKKWDGYSVSISCFQVFLGLKKDLAGQLGITDSEIFLSDGYDMEADYEAALRADVENCGYGVTIYDNIYEGYSPDGKNTLNLLVLQGYDHWERYEADYFKGEKTEYRAEKERMADTLIRRIEERLMPGLADAIEVKEIGTPLTNVRYTSNYRGAMYGWDQTMSNSGSTRVPHSTPVKNLFLSGAWSNPGHGYTAVIYSGLSCFGEIMQGWEG
jgi:phytoene dehydrogenase-like protein